MNSNAQILEMRQMMARLRRQNTPEERNQLASARSRADGVYAALGRTPPEALPGEGPLAYRQRLAYGLRDTSPTLRRAHLDGLPSAAFGAVEEKIYQDAMTAAQTGAGIPRGQVRPHTFTGQTGHQITEYHGDPMGWMSPFMSPGVTLRVRSPAELK